MASVAPIRRACPVAFFKTNRYISQRTQPSLTTSSADSWTIENGMMDHFSSITIDWNMLPEGGQTILRHVPHSFYVVSQ